MLAERTIRAAKAAEKDQFIADGGGLYVRIAKTGTKTFVFRDTRGGTSRWKSLGVYPDLPLAEARRMVAKLKSRRVTLSVGDAWAEYYPHLAKEYADPTQTKRMVEKDLLPDLRDRDISLVEKSEWMDAINKVKKRGSPIMANRLLTQTRKFLDYAEDQGWIEFNPVTKVRTKNVGGKEKSTTRHLSFDEIVGFFRLITSTTHRMAPSTRLTLYLCLLTGLRASEALSLRDTGGEFASGVCKMTRAGTIHYKVPLTIEVRAALKLLSRHPRPKDHRVLSQALRDLKCDYTPHTLRHTVSSRMADLGIMPHVSEKILNHVMQGSMAVYNHAEYWDERVAAMRLWGAKLRMLRHEAKKNRGS